MKPPTRKRSGGKGSKARGVGGRRTFCTPETTETIVEVLEAGGTFEDAAKAARLNPATPLDWMKKGEQGVAPYAEFAEAVARARERRPVAVLRTLVSEMDWRAREAYLRQLQARETSRSNRRIKDAEARILEAKAAAVEAMSQQGGAGLLMLAEDVLGDMPPELAAQVSAHLASRGMGVLPREDLAGDVSDDDVAGASPTPMGDDR